MLTTTGGILIRTRVADMQPDRPQHPGRPPDPRRRGGRRRLLAKLPEEELAAAAELEDLPDEADAAGAAAADGHPTPHILDDGVGQAEASDHIDDLDADGEPDA